MPKCSATTKKGTPCKFEAVPGYDNLCSIHFDSILEKEIKAECRSNPMCKIKDCKDRSFGNSDGYCPKHWFEFGFAAFAAREGAVCDADNPSPPIGGAGAAQVIRPVTSDSAITNAFRELEMEPTHDCEAVKAKFREIVKRPDIRIAFTNVEITPETQSAKAKFEKLKTAFDFLKSIGRA